MSINARVLDAFGLTMTTKPTGDIIMKTLEIFCPLTNVACVARMTQTVERSNGIINIVAGGRRGFVKQKWTLQ